MSNESDNGGVILIAPETNNQDGTQTYYILDPCPSEQSVSESKIELIDLTAEVKNTGTIAVLSSNSNTGAWEIKFTEKPDPMDRGNVKHLLSEGGYSSEMMTDDDLAQCVVKEEEDDVDVEEISCAENQDKESDGEFILPDVNSEVDSEGFTVREINQQVEHEQEDESEEGALYIDDIRSIEQQEETENTTIIPGKRKKIVNSTREARSSAGNSAIEEVKNMIEKADFVIKETEHSLKEMNSSEEDGASEKTVSNTQSALIREHLIEVQTEQIGTQKPPDAEYVDCTNTALTLLELAGGSYRNDEGLEMEVIEIHEDEASTNAEQIQEEQLITLTTLQPVTVDIPESSTSTLAFSNVNPKEKTTKELQPSAPTQIKLRAPYAECAQTQIQRLMEGDIPKLGQRSFRGLSSPIISQKEIAEEIIERTKPKVPYSEPKDIFFTMKIAHRLANRIVPPEKSVSDSSCNDKDKIDQASSFSENEGSTLSTPSPRKGSISTTDEINNTTLQQNRTISDKYELLKILEDDPDDPDSIPDLDESKLLDKIINKKSKIKRQKSKFSPLIKLHPELEKELALKQLENFGSKQGRKSLMGKKSLQISNEALRKSREYNNNTNGKRRSGESLVASKRFKTEPESSSAITADPSQVTETLAVEGQEAVPDQTKDSKSIKQYSNKRLSRNSETPPREIPMEILLNGVEDEVDVPDDGKVKNKIFKATNPRKRQEELKKKKQTHFANVLQRNKPQKKRGRPPKKKIPPVDNSFNDDLIILPNKKEKLKNGDGKKEPEIAEDDSLKDEKSQKVKKLTEIEKLLGDEGAINMLYSVEQKRAVGSEPKRGVLPSYRRKKKDLILKTKLVKSAVLRLSASPAQNESRISLRERTTKEDNEEVQEETPLRKMSVDSRDSHHSVTSTTAEIFPFPTKIVPAEASRIIRRHSSSSNYSSRSNSPRRLSVDGSDRPPETPELGQGDAPLPSPSTHKHNRSSLQNDATPVKRMSKDLKQEQSKEPNKPLTTPPSATSYQTKLKDQPKTTSGKPRGRPRKVLVTEDQIKKRSELESSLSAAVNDFTKEIENIDRNIPTPKKVSSSTASITSPIPKLSNKVYKRTSEGPGRGRHKSSVVYQELSLHRHGPLVEITLAPVSTRLKNALNANVLREVTAVLTGLTKDENCRVVLITSAGSVFCQGVDFFSLLQDSAEKRKSAALETAVAIKDFIKALAMFSKPVVAGVQGPTVGLGVTMLPLCDLVYCSELATFHTPYARLGQVPEGAATLTLPAVVGNSATSELLFGCRKLTANESHSLGLVTKVLGSEDFHSQLLSIVSAMANQSSQAMDATKALLRHNLLSGLETTLISETHLLIQHWASEECQRNFALYLQDDEQTLALQKQPT